MNFASIDARRRRILYRSVRRGTKEADLVIGVFAEEYLDRLTDEELDQFESLLSVSDPDLMSWIGGMSDPNPAHDNPVLKMLIDFKVKK